MAFLFGYNALKANQLLCLACHSLLRSSKLVAQSNFMQLFCSHISSKIYQNLTIKKNYKNNLAIYLLIQLVDQPCFLIHEIPKIKLAFHLNSFYYKYCLHGYFFHQEILHLSLIK
jgi:hypothetical protein